MIYRAPKSEWTESGHVGEWTDAKWQDKLTGSSVSLDDVWKWRLIVNQMKGYDVERKVAEWKMNAWTLELCETV